MAETLSLKSLLVPSKTVEVEYPGYDGFKLSLNFLSRETLVNIRKKATKTSYKNRQAKEELDEELFLDLYVKACIKGWSGLKLKYLQELAPVDISGKNQEDEFAYSQDDALALMQASANFDSFISETVTDLSNFTKNSTKV